jgi:excisionase family DNA binding protein
MSQSPEIQKLLLSKRDAALALSLSVRTVENLIRRKELTARRVGRRTLVLASSLATFARRDHDSPSPSKRKNELNAEDVHQRRAADVGTET